MEILSGADECIHYRLLDELSGFSFFIGHVFSNFFFPLKRTSTSSFTLLAKYRKKELKPNCKSSHQALKVRRPFVGFFAVQNLKMRHQT